MTMQAQTTEPRYARLGEIARLVERFEDGSLPREQWNHAAHLTVALWYMLCHEEAAAVQRMIDGIRAYNRANGIRQTRTGGYHETITLFWLAIARRHARQVRGGSSTLDAVNAFVDCYTAQPKLILEYYTKERIGSLRARQFWVEPDLQALD